MPPFHIFALLDGRLVGSEHPGATGRADQVVAEMVDRFQVGAMLTLTPAFRDFHRSGLRQHHVPMEGMPTLDDLEAAVGSITKHLDRGENVWVHCQQGIDRAGVVLAAALVSLGIETETALAQIESKFPDRRQTMAYKDTWEGYREVVRAFARCASQPRSN